MRLVATYLLRDGAMGTLSLPRAMATRELEPLFQAADALFVSKSRLLACRQTLCSRLTDAELRGLLSQLAPDEYAFFSLSSWQLTLVSQL